MEESQVSLDDSGLFWGDSQTSYISQVASESQTKHTDPEPRIFAETGSSKRFSDPSSDKYVAEKHILFPSVTFKHTNLTDNEIQFLTDLFASVEHDKDTLSAEEKRNVEKNMRYANDVLFGEVSSRRLQQVRVIETLYGPHCFQGYTNYCGYCCVSNALRELTSIIHQFKPENSFDSVQIYVVNSL